MINYDLCSRDTVSTKLVWNLIEEFTASNKEFNENSIPLIGSFVKSHFFSLRETILVEAKNVHTINSFNLRKFIKEGSKLHISLFEKISLLLTLCAEYGESVSTQSQNLRKEDPVLDVLLNLYLHAWNAADEVFYLLLGGYGHAAQSRWRSLYENFIISRFIHMKGNECAIAFMEHAVIDEYALMNKAIEYKDEIRQSPPTEKQFNDCKTRYDFVIEKYGESFARPYGWAKKFISPTTKERITFAKIEMLVDQSRMRFYYSDASICTHPSSYSFYKYDGILSSERGNTRSLYVGHGLALTLVQMASMLCTVSPPLIEYLFVISLLVELVDQIAKELEE